MTTQQIRLHNARLLQEKVGGQKAMIEKTGRSQSQISALMGDNPHKNIGPNIARSLEECFSLPRGWMDVWHESTEEKEKSAEAVQEIPALYAVLTGTTDQIELLRSVIETVETIELEEGLKLSPEEKARAIVACLKICIKRGMHHATDKTIIATAIQAVI